MDTVRPPARTHWVRLGLAAAGVALGWAAFTTVTGWGATASHAADGDDDKSLLGSLVGTVSEVAEVLPDVVEEPVVTVVKKVEKTATEVVRTTDKTVDTVTKSKPVKKATTTVTRTVKKVPVVRDVAERTGITDAIDTIGDTSTGIVRDVSETVDVVVDAVVPPSDSESLLPEPEPDFDAHPSVPPIPSASTETVVDDADDSRATSAFPPTAEVHTSASLRQTVDATPGVSTAVAGHSSAPQTGSAAPARPAGSPGLPGLPDASGAAVAVNGLPSPTQGSSALASHDPTSAAPAWLRSERLEGEVLPASPVFPPDASPD